MKKVHASTRRSLMRCGFDASEIGDIPEDIRGCVVILKPSALPKLFRTRNEMLLKPTCGFGCDERLRGSAVFGVDAWGDIQQRERHEIAARFLGVREPGRFTEKR